MIINILCDTKNSWIIPYIDELKVHLEELDHEIHFVNSCENIVKGELAFFLSCERLVPSKYLKLNNHNLVVHESDLPQGKGWSPVTWQVLEGKNKIPVTLFEATENVDSGTIYTQDYIILNGKELLTEIKHKQGGITKKLIIDFVNNYPNMKGRKQSGEESFYKRRIPKDSELDINKSINEQFDLLRVVDNERYPAFFIKDNKKFIIKIYEGEES